MAEFQHHTGGVIQVECAGRWGAVPEALIEDNRLGLDTRAVAAWLAMKVNGWQISIKFLRQRLNLKEERWLRMAREMEDAGYFSRRRMKGEMGRWVWNIVFSAVPTIPGFSVHGSPVPGSSMHGQPVDKSNTKVTTTKVTTTTTTTTPAGAGAGGGVYFEELPAGLQDKARALVQELPPNLQADVIDELLGQIQEGVVKQPERLLRVLVRAARDGALTLDFARRHRERRCREEVVAVAAAAPAPADFEEVKEKGATLLQRIAPSVASRMHSST